MELERNRIMIENHLLQKLKREINPIGIMVGFVRNPAIITLLSQSGFDFVIIDLEHSAYSTETVSDMAQVARARNITPIIRAPASWEPLGRLLDMGPQGILLPGVQDQQTVQTAIEQIRYYPKGNRGISFNNGHTDYSPYTNRQETTEFLNKETLIILQIETILGVKNIETFINLDPTLAVLIGLNDLSQSMGITGQIQHPQVIDAVMNSINICKRHSVPIGIHVYSVDQAQAWMNRNIDYLVFSSDTRYLLKAKDDVNAIKQFTKS